MKIGMFGDPMAEIFETEFPACTEEQARRLEEAYSYYVSQAEKHEGEKPDPSLSCACDLVIALLKGEAAPGAQLSAGRIVASWMYEQKMSADRVLETMLQSMGGGEPTETLH